ncbi:glycosyltransferase family 2 protein [Maribellus sediminis]|uniref:glycosyltransferase family 2 protein n=1 Tax=Maribellus sediminis TaxID=2696285 RepID=UPI00197CB60C|nr:glycosyltransferase family 2 protein [Maribellus sediminis]
MAKGESIEVSLITATFNSAKNLADCLQSVADQDYPNIEHIVIDGGSSDGTMEIVKSFPTVSRYISEPDKGIYDALNKGIKLATGDVIGFVHSDDMLAGKDIVSKIVECFEHHLPPPSSGYSSSMRRRNEKVEGVYGNLVFVDPDDTNKAVRYWISTPFDRNQVKHGWMPPHPTLFLHRKVYKKHGLFDISFKIAGDYDFLLRALRDESINLVLLPETIVKMRKGGASTGNFRELIRKKQEDLRAMRNNGFSFPLWVLIMKNVRKLPQLWKNSNK